MISKTSSSDWANERCLLIVCFIWVSILSIFSRDSCSINRAFCFVLGRKFQKKKKILKCFLSVRRRMTY